MTEIQSQQSITNQKRGRYRNLMVIYLDGTIRGLLSFFIVGIGLFLLLVGVFHLNTIAVIIVAFLVSILISPLFSKIRVAEKLITKYEAWLNKIWEK